VSTNILSFQEHYWYLLDGAVSIGQNAFSGCVSLKNIVIPSTVHTIGKNALRGCEKLEKLTIPFIGNSVLSNTTPYLGYLFGGLRYSNGYKMVPESLKEVTITTNFNIPDFAFYKCSSIESINIVKEIEAIGSNAFRNCSGLKKINIPDSVKNIGKAAFTNCSALEEIKLPASLENLEEAVFANCINLEKVTIESNLKEIASNSFQNCVKLTNFSINKDSNFTFENGKLFILKDTISLVCIVFPYSVV
jgi:hypothetical protein